MQTRARPRTRRELAASDDLAEIPASTTRNERDWSRATPWGTLGTKRGDAPVWCYSHARLAGASR